MSAADRYQRPVYIVSAVLCAAVAFLILGPRPEGLAGSVDVSGLPAVNATLNGLAALLLAAGFVAIKQKRITLHKRLMLSAFATSGLFLCSYVVYHWFSAGPRHYEGGFRGLYLIILFSHIVLAAVILPLALTTLARALTGSIEAHRRIAPRTLAIWQYVSVTGVVIFWMLYG